MEGFPLSSFYSVQSPYSDHTAGGSPSLFKLSGNSLTNIHLQVWLLSDSISSPVILFLSTLQGAPFTKLCINVVLGGQYCPLMEVHGACSPVCSNFKCTCLEMVQMTTPQREKGRGPETKTPWQGFHPAFPPHSWNVKGRRFSQILAGCLRRGNPALETQAFRF